MVPPDVLARCEGMYQRNRDKVVVGEKTADELLQAARAFVDLREVDPTGYTAKASIRRWKQNFAPLFQAGGSLWGKVPVYAHFLVEPTEKNRVYFSSDQDLTEAYYLLDLEKTSVYFHCASPLLFARLCRAAGISPQDLAARGDEFALYMMNSFPEDPDNPLFDPSPYDDVVSVCTVEIEPDDP